MTRPRPSGGAESPEPTAEMLAKLALEKAARPYTIRVLPWFLAGLMLAVYALTLNHWVSPGSVMQTASLQGLALVPKFNGPVNFVVTSALGVLPAEWVPVGLNLFTAVCAALALGILARSVALLPHNLRKNPQPWWVITPPELMARRCPWLPPLVAVLVCGLQLTFWQNAVVGTSQMFNLLLFAFVVLCLLEFNATRRDAWLLRGAFVFGLAMANDWVMTAFLPALLLALVLVKRLFIFSEIFIGRLVTHPETLQWRLLWLIPLCWMAGLAFFLLTPLIISLTPLIDMHFWPALKYVTGTYEGSLAHFPRQLLIISSLVSLTPFIIISDRFYQFLAGFNRINLYVPPVEGETQVHYLTGANRLPLFAGTVFFQLIYAFFLFAGLWTAFDSPLSPRRLGLGDACLPLYYLGALSIGYFTGHFLLTTEVTGKSPPLPRLPREVSPMEKRNQWILFLTPWLKRLGLVLILLLVLTYPVSLAMKNLPEIMINRSDPCGDYIKQLERELPPEGGVIIGSDEFRLLYLQSALVRSRRKLDFMVLDTAIFTSLPPYAGFLKQNYPGFGLAALLDPASADAGQPARQLATLLRQLVTKYQIYCLPPVPVDEPFTEFCYLQPHGLFYRLLPYTLRHPTADPPTPEVISNNVAFWQTFEERQLPGLLARINPPRPPRSAGLVSGFLNTLRFWPEADEESLEAADYYATALNDWGVERQRAGDWTAAGKYFAEARQLSPFNTAAEINEQYNRNHLANKPDAWLAPLQTAMNLGQYRGWRNVAGDGLVDDPNFCYMLGTFMEEDHLPRPAIEQFRRASQLDPARLDVYVTLAGIYLEHYDYSNVLSAADSIIELSPTNETGYLVKANACLALADFQRAIPLYGRVIDLNPSNLVAFVNRGVAYRQAVQLPAASRDFESAIRISPAVFQAYLNLAEIADHETNRPAAITNYELFLKYAPTNSAEIAQVRERMQALAGSK